MREKGTFVRYTGREVIDVPGVGVFQHGTTAFVAREKALELLARDDFEWPGEPKPALQVVFRVGQAGPQMPKPPASPGDAPADTKEKEEGAS
jgi:hypothetical protein